MNSFNLQFKLTPPRVLATDLDGTLIPLPDHPENVSDLATLAAAIKGDGKEIVFATGRHFESVLQAIESYGLPRPDWMVCDVGSSIYRWTGDQYALFSLYEEHLVKSTVGLERSAVIDSMKDITALELQPDACQKRCKISYFCPAEEVETLCVEMDRILEAQSLPFSTMGSVDPFEGCGLLDILPKGVSKASALLWLATHADFQPGEVVFSGDSGNDYAALVSGFRAILVANASDELREQVLQEMEKNNFLPRIYCTKSKATSGVLEGCRHYGLLK